MQIIKLTALDGANQSKGDEANGTVALKDRGKKRKGDAVIRVVLLDEHELVRIGLKTVLKQDPGISVIADLSDANNALGLIRRELPDLIFIDIREDTPLAEFSMLDALRRIHPNLKIVLLSTVFDLDCLLHTLCGNAAGYLLKDTRPEELVSAVHAVACGGVYINATLLERLPKQLLKTGGAGRAATPCAPELSAREHSVLDLLVKGYTNREVSEQLYLSPKTVEAYRAKIYTKFGVRTRSALVSHAVDYGMVAF
jgi:two-component system response regulator NreC